VGLGYVDAQKQLSQGGSPVMPGLEPGIQAAPSVVIPGKSTLDARVKPVHDETESGSPYFWAFGVQKNYAAPSLSHPHKRQNTLRPIKSN